MGNKQLKMPAISKKPATRPKKYHCDFEGCLKAYSRPCLLEQHIRTHSNERPFKCGQCGKAFFRDSHLKVHLWTHSSDKPLRCEICSKGFVTSQQLGRHVKTHSIDEFKCPYECDESFPTNDKLSEHMLSTHIMSDFVDANTHQMKTDETLNMLRDQLDYSGIRGIPTFEVYTSPTPKAGDIDDGSNGYKTVSSTSTDAYDNLNLSKGKTFWDNWDDHHCKEPNCKGYPKYNSFQDLIYHYDEYHSFIPESLFEAFESNPEESSTGRFSNEWNL